MVSTCLHHLSQLASERLPVSDILSIFLHAAEGALDQTQFLPNMSFALTILDWWSCQGMHEFPDDSKASCGNAFERFHDIV
jgi:hypothetical protein